MFTINSNSPTTSSTRTTVDKSLEMKLSRENLKKENSDKIKDLHKEVISGICKTIIKVTINRKILDMVDGSESSKIIHPLLARIIAQTKDQAQILNLISVG